MSLAALYVALADWQTARRYLPAHHPAGPSRLLSLDLCPASLRESAGLERQSAEATWGTGMHAATLGTPPDDLSDYDRGLVELARTFIEDELAPRLPGKAAKEVFLIVERESRVVNWGTADAVFLGEDGRALVIDLKFYRTPISEESLTLQTANYAAAILPYFDRVETVGYNPITRITLRTTYEQADLPRIVGRIEGIIGAAQEPDAPYRPSLEACAYCPAVGRCKAARDTIGIYSALVPAEAVELPEKQMAEAVREKVRRADPASILAAIDGAKLAGIVSKAIVDEAKALLRSGVECETHELQRRAGRRFFRSTTEARKALVVPGGLTQEQFDDCASVAVGKAEKAWKAAAGTTLDQQAGHAIARSEDTFALVKKRRKQIR